MWAIFPKPRQNKAVTEEQVYNDIELRLKPAEYV